MDFTQLEFQKNHAMPHLKARRQVPAQLLITHSNGNVSIVDMDFTDDDTKFITSMVMRKFLNKVDAKSYVLISESWISNQFDVQPSKSKSRKEMVMFDCWDNVGNNSTYMWEISRLESGAGVIDERICMNSPRSEHSTAGLLTNFFDASPLLELTGTQLRKIDKAASIMITKRSKFKYSPNTLH